MRILLIRPNSKIVKTPPPLGLMYLASFIRQKGFRDIKIIDARRKRLSDEALKDEIEKFNPNIVGITGLHFESTKLHNVAKLVKSYNKEAIVVIGGPYSSCDYRRALEDSSIDYAVIGEGEESFYDLIKNISEQKSIEGLKGIAYSYKGEFRYTPREKYIEDLDYIPQPAWDMVSLEEYFDSKRLSIGNPLQVEEKAVPIFTSRGCPFGCYYCHNLFGKKVRFRSPQNVIDEISYLVSKYGVKEIEILDDVFNIDKQRAKKICDMILEKGIEIKINFGNGLRADVMDEELIDKLKKAGTYRMIYGVETGSSRMQEVIGKRLDLDKAKEVIRMTVAKGISTGGFFMIGFPGETKEEILSTIEFAKHSKLHTASFYYVKPFPGTSLDKMIEKKGFSYDCPQFSSYNTLSDNLTNVDNRELKNLKRKAYRDFYLNIPRIAGILKTTPNKIGLFKNALSAFRLMLKDTMVN